MTPRRGWGDIPWGGDFKLQNTPRISKYTLLDIRFAPFDGRPLHSRSLSTQTHQQQQHRFTLVGWVALYVVRGALEIGDSDRVIWFAI